MQNLLSIAAITTILAQASPAPAPVPGAPTGPSWSSIDVRKCTIIPQEAHGLRAQGVEIDFANHATVVATHVNFGVTYNKKSAVIPDKGSFAPGTVVKHVFLNQFVGESLTSLTPDVCRVRDVTFADGTVSTAPASPEPQVSST